MSLSCAGRWRGRRLHLCRPCEIVAFIGQMQEGLAMFNAPALAYDLDHILR
jgi:hypothetical protein